MTRRGFLAVLSCIRKPPLVLEAIAAEKMPHRLMVSGVALAPFFELRDYGETAPVFQGLEPVWQENGRMLFAFESLEAREKAWRKVTVPQCQLTELSIYRTATFGSGQPMKFRTSS